MSAIFTFESSRIESLANRGRPCMCGGRWVTTVPTATLQLAPSQRGTATRVDRLVTPGSHQTTGLEGRPWGEQGITFNRPTKGL